MKIENALKRVEDLLLGSESIPVQLRNKEGLDEEKFDSLVETLGWLIDYYNDKDSVPKVLALSFVDLNNYFFVDEMGYSDEDIEKIEDAGIKLSELANQLFESNI
jgi:hypothetical protein